MYGVMSILAFCFNHFSTFTVAYYLWRQNPELDSSLMTRLFGTEVRHEVGILIVVVVHSALLRYVGSSLVPDVTKRSNSIGRDSLYRAAFLDFVVTYLYMRLLIYLVSISLTLFKDYQISTVIITM